jgi:nitronate monooxygenase
MNELPKLTRRHGVAISDWRLAKAVSKFGQLGVVSGTGISRVLASRLMDGDLSGNVRRALANFSLPEPVQNIINRYYTPGGKSPETPYKTPAAYTIKPPTFLDQITAIANFVEVYLAKEGHSGIVGINLLEKCKCQTWLLSYGAMLAGGTWY